MKFVHICIILSSFQGVFVRRLSNSSDSILPTKRVIGGLLAKIEDFPSTACLILKNKDVDDFRGGAAIVSEYWAVTAAHCMAYIDSSDINKGIAFVRSNSARWTKHYIDHLIIQSLIHDRYDASETDYDIALLKVNRAFKGKNEKPVKLPSSSYKYVEHSIATVLGWGTTDATAVESFVVQKLRFANLEIMNSQTCKGNYKNIGEIVTNRMICAGSPGKDACIYDSGGPLYQNNLLIGLVSWGGTRCADKMLPGIYTKVSLFTQWINKKITMN